MSQFESTLEEKLAATLRRLGLSNAANSVPLRHFIAVEQAASYVSQRFDYGAPPAPPLDQRRAAIRKFQAGEPLTTRDWRLVSYGLVDSVIEGTCLLQKDELFAQVRIYFVSKIKAGDIRRKTWFGLVSSYFDFNDPQRATNPSWISLRGIVLAGFRKLEAEQTSPKKWIATVNRHIALFTEKPAYQLAGLLLEGDNDELFELKTTLQIPENSWLWELVFADLAAYINAMPEAVFTGRINSLIELMSIYPRHADKILSIILNRYANSSFCDTIHHGLKDIALERWGSPQINLKKNLWLHHAGEIVAKMVLRWFAKDDLEHFFKLLQGEEGVDQNRLTYWLRFVDKMAFTKILLGHDAFYDRGTEYIEFRARNKGRFGKLTGGAPNNNAFVMQIADYIFVEFSGKGNACYAYHSSDVPFSIGSGLLNVNHDLKKLMALKIAGVMQNKFNHMSNWEAKADAFLSRLGIAPDEHVTSIKKSAKPESSRSNVKTNPNISGVNKKQNNSSENSKVNDAIRAARSELKQKSCSLPEEDRRGSGGAFFFITNARIASVDRKLTSWGFQFNGHGYWIK